MSISSQSPIDIHTLCELFIFTNALRDHLEAVFQHSERLSKEVTELLEQALQGRRSPLGPTLALASRQSEQQARATRLLQRAETCAQTLALQFGTLGEAPPRAVHPAQVEGLVGLIDGVAMLQPLGDTHTGAAQLAGLQASVEQLIAAALRGEDLTIGLGLVEAERLRFVTNGPEAETGCACISEAIVALSRGSGRS